jgi:hypothetical protein
MIPSVTVFVRPPVSAIDTPAAKNVNTGTAMPAEIVRRSCSKRSAKPCVLLRSRTGTVKAGRIPATVV